MLLAVDFDDTLMNTKDIQSGYRMGRPEPGAILSMQRLQQEGHTLVIFTGRDVTDQRIYKAVADWLEYFNIPYHNITNIKDPRVDVWIDDRALRFHSWAQTLAELKILERHPQAHTHQPGSTLGLLTDITRPLDQQPPI